MYMLSIGKLNIYVLIRYSSIQFLKYNTLKCVIYSKTQNHITNYLKLLPNCIRL